MTTLEELEASVEAAKAARTKAHMSGYAMTKKKAAASYAAADEVYWNAVDARDEAKIKLRQAEKL